MRFSSISSRVFILPAPLLQLTVGTYHGTFGNLLPYFSSYMRQVNELTQRKTTEPMKGKFRFLDVVNSVFPEEQPVFIFKAD